MLNEATKLGIQEILSAFDNNSLFSLTTTITHGLLKDKIENRQEAVNAILNYSSDAISILRRKIITREILFKYLHHKNIPINLPATKNDLIKKIAEFWNIHYKQEIDTDNNTSDTASIADLAEQFTQWFYSMFNKNECINPEHFYPDANLKINIMNNGQLLSEIIENNSVEIVQKLLLTKINHNLYFNPNLSSEGVQGRIDPHGLVLVLVCGTLHTNSVCVGIFEQVFALVRDPYSENNWRIKSTELNLKSQSGIVTPPALCDNELTANLLHLPSN